MYWEEKLEEAKSNYLKLKTSEGAAKKTLAKYERVINSYEWNDITSYETFMNRFNELYGSKAKKTQSDYYTILKNFSKFLKDKKLIDFWLYQRNPIRVERKPVEFLTREEVQEIKCGFNNDNKYMDWEDEIVFEVFLNTGIRLEEFDQLTDKEILIEKKDKILITGKGGHKRYIYITKHLREFLNVAEKHFVNGDGTKQPILDGIDRNEIVYSFRKISQKMGIKITPHKLRRTFATNLSLKGANIAAISHLLGHSNIKTTTDYIATPEIYAEATINLYMNEFDDSYATMSANEKIKYLENKIKILHMEKKGII